MTAWWSGSMLWEPLDITLTVCLRYSCQNSTTFPTSKIISFSISYIQKWGLNSMLKSKLLNLFYLYNFLLTKYKTELQKSNIYLSFIANTFRSNVYFASYKEFNIKISTIVHSGHICQWGKFRIVIFNISEINTFMSNVHDISKFLYSFLKKRYIYFKKRDIIKYSN